MPLALASPITDLPRIGPAKAKLLRKLGIQRVRDLLYTFPRRYDDFSTITPISQLVPSRLMTVRARVKSIQQQWGWRGRQRLLRIFVELEDDTGTLNVTWYNLRFLPKQLWKGRQLFVAGKVELASASAAAGVPAAAPPLAEAEAGPAGTQTRSIIYRMRSPVLEFAGAQDTTHTGRITPIYPETAGVTSRFLRYHVKSLLPLIDAVPEYLPADIRRRRDLIGIRQAIREAHFPSNQEQLTRAQQRLRFDELFFLQLAAQTRRRQQRQEKTFPLRLKPFKHAAKLPYRLTAAQKEALRDITADMRRPHPMNRLLQGDVGSGKSAIAQLLTADTLAAHHAVLYLAPTEILARQQAELFAAFLSGASVFLLLGATPPAQRRALRARLSAHDAVCVIGTHALLQEDISLSHCALAIIDEQHRFGVDQRQRLQQRNRGLVPHLLTMTATPIPRTLSLTVYGDLDVSVLDELPARRRPIQTTICAPHQRPQAWQQLTEELARGRQAYVIAPLVEQSERLQAKSAQETLRDVRQRFPHRAVELVHGRLKPEEKEAVMRSFAAGAIHILVATSVVEVGVNVPNATCIVIEGAELFGLSQLHQMRGRVGRAEHQSYCFLLPTTAEAAQTERLHVLAKTADGFVIAEEDLRLRGPGEVYGTAQSGFSHLQVASLLDYPTIKATREEAERLLGEDPNLDGYPILKAKVEQKNLKTHFE